MRTNVKRGVLEIIMYFSRGLILASQIIKNAFNNLFDLDNYEILVIILCNCYVSWEAVINRRQYLKILQRSYYYDEWVDKVFQWVWFV